MRIVSLKLEVASSGTNRSDDGSAGTDDGPERADGGPERADGGPDRADDGPDRADEGPPGGPSARRFASSSWSAGENMRAMRFTCSAERVEPNGAMACISSSTVAMRAS